LEALVFNEFDAFLHFYCQPYETGLLLLSLAQQLHPNQAFHDETELCELNELPNPLGNQGPYSKQNLPKLLLSKDDQ
jgi:hypothetical protein